MKIGLKMRHPAGQKPSILTDTVATDGRGPLRNPLREKVEGLPFSLLRLKGTLNNACHQTRLTMMSPVPLVHTVKHRLRLVDNQLRTFSKVLAPVSGENQQEPAEPARMKE